MKIELAQTKAQTESCSTKVIELEAVRNELVANQQKWEYDTKLKTQEVT